MLPSKITFYCKPKDDNDVYHAFPVDAEANHDTARGWAGGSRWDKDKGKKVTVFEFDNSNFDHVTIKSLDIRGEGGRAYQVILEREGKKFKVDLRENTLMDVIRNTGIQAGGRLNGTFCFVKNKSQTTLIREGTEEHKQAAKDAQKRAEHTENIKKADLKPGYRYSTIGGKRMVFLGHVYTQEVDKTDGTVGKPYKAMLFYEMRNISESTRKLLEGDLSKEVTDEVFHWSFKITKSHSLRVEEDKVIDVDLDKFVKNINKFGELVYQEKFNHYIGTYWRSEMVDCYELAHFKVNKKDLDFKQTDCNKMIDHYLNKTGRHRRW